MAEALLSSRETGDSETLSNPEKFGGDPEVICGLLEMGKIKNVVNIDDLRPELAGFHSNEVNLADVEAGYNIEGHIHQAFAVEIESGDRVIQGVFKPLSGENQEVKAKLHVEDCYKRERAAYLLDRFLGFGLVPPTVIREINGRVGSLQLYIPTEVADNHRLLSGEIDHDTEQGGRDWQLMAAFDYISGNWERKPDNWLVNRKDNRQLYAIDHGYAFDDQAIHSFNKRGPRLALTHDNEKNKPINTPLPDFITTRITRAPSKAKEMCTQLKGIVPEREADGVVKRAQRLLESGRFL